MEEIIMEQNAYPIFLMIELARVKAVIDTELEHDLTWDRGIELYNEFSGHQFDDEDKPLYDCIVEFINNKIETK